MQQSEYEAFDAFVHARQGDLLRFAHTLTGQPAAAADLLQDALERTLLAWPRVRRRDDPEGYVRRVMVNRQVSLWRRSRREHLMSEVPDTGVPALDATDDALREALAGLPPRQRAVLVLRFGEDLSERQAAEMLGCSVGTVKSQTSKALAKLRATLRMESEGTWIR